MFGPQRPELEEGVAALNTLAMGDCSACDFAQGAHIMLLLRSGAAKKEEMMLSKLPPPRGLLSVGAVIDDLVLLEKVLKEDLIAIRAGIKKTMADERIRLALGGYADANLLVNEKKAFHNASLASFWGIELDGVKAIVKPSATRLYPLIGITFRVCCLGLASAALLSSLAGSWISVFLVRRRLMSSMNLIFEAINCSSSGTQVIRLSPALIDELYTYCFLGSLCWLNLRASTNNSVRCTDASDWGMAGTVAELDKRMCHEFLRRSLVKSVWTQLLPPAKAWLRSKNLLNENLELPEDTYDCHPLWEILARCLHYRETWRAEHRKRVHINVAELRAHLREESRLAVVCPSSKQLYGLNSQVSLGSLVKGRASSPALNAELLRSLPVIIGSDLYGFYMFYPSKVNRADAPTRGASPPAPDMDLPAWWEHLLAGDPMMFDSWMKEVSLVPYGGVPKAFASAAVEMELDFSSSSRLRGKAVVSAQKDHIKISEALDQLRDGEPTTKGGTSDASEVGCLPDEAVQILQTFSNQQILWRKGTSRFLHPGALDLFSGRAGIARCLVRYGCPWVVTFEWNRSSSEDLLDEELRGKIIRLVQLKAVLLVGSAIICCSFSIAVTPPCRTTRYPRGRPGLSASMRRKVAQGNSHSDYHLKLLEECEAVGCMWWF